MKPLTQRFTTTQSNQNILELPEIIEAIKITYGENSSTYNDIINHKPTKMEIPMLFCDSETRIEIRGNYDTPEFPQALIDGFLYYPKNNIVQIISTQPTSGIIQLMIE